jgi:hypothetical protein
MGMRTTIQAKLAIAFAGPLADAVKEFTFTSKDNEPSYDPEIGIGATDVVIPGLSGAFVDFTVKELVSINSSLSEKEKVRPTDVKLIALQNILTTRPKKGDSVVITDGIAYRVLSWSQDPAQATYAIQLRTMADA